jgi:two-component system phosphate regulon response regulator PhoB
LSGARSAAGKPLVLIVEDEPSIVELVVYTLNQAGCESVVAGTAGQAWECLMQRLPNLILLDWMLPDQSGLRFLSRMRSDRQFSDIPVMMLTAKSTEEDKVAGLDNGADDYVTKPFSPRELSARVKALLRRKTPEHGGVPLDAGRREAGDGPCRIPSAQVSACQSGTRFFARPVA